MEGFVQHTNEILVPLGCGLHVWQSAKQATALIERRLKAIEARVAAREAKIEELLRPFVSAQSLLAAAQKAKAAQDVGGFMDIREPYTEEDEQRGETPAPCPPPCTVHVVPCSVVAAAVLCICCA